MRRACLILTLVALFLGGSTGVAFAGHALDSPVATTNPGDFWVSGNMDCDGTSVWDGVATFNANAIFTLDVSVGDDLTVTSDATIGGELKGARCILPIGSNATNKTTDEWLKGGGFMSFGATHGYKMNRAGSIVGATFMYNVDSYTPVATVELEVRVNNVEVYPLSDTLAATGVGDVYGTQARGTDTFSAGDIITAVVDVTGTVQYDIYGGYIEVQFDD